MISKSKTLWKFLRLLDLSGQPWLLCKMERSQEYPKNGNTEFHSRISQCRMDEYTLQHERTIKYSH